jgi:hypothetical protein
MVMFREFDESIELEGQSVQPAHTCIIVKPNANEKDVEGFLVRGTQEIVSGYVLSVGENVMASVVPDDLVYFVRSGCLQFKHDNQDLIVVPDVSIRAWSAGS